MRHDLHSLPPESHDHDAVQAVMGPQLVVPDLRLIPRDLPVYRRLYAGAAALLWDLARGGPLSRVPPRLVFFASALTIAIVLLFVALLLPLGHRPPWYDAWHLSAGAVLALATVAGVLLLLRRTQRVRASKQFGVHIDRRPRR